MEYSELAYLAKQKKISIASIVEAMGMTRQGFHAGIVAAVEQAGGDC